MAKTDQSVVIQANITVYDKQLCQSSGRYLHMV